MSERVLFVDDEPNILEAIQRTLRKQVNLETATSGAEGLVKLRDSGPFALVVSDMRMPVMNGAQFLAKVREHAPDSVRMILSGQADLQATIAAVNEGHIFRFLSKPCPPEQLLVAVADGVRQYRLLTAEKVLLEQTLSGAIKMLIEILGFVSPAASSRAARLQRYTRELSASLSLAERWEWGLAAFVSQIGCVALPKEVLTKVEAGQALSEEERKLYESHPEIASKLLIAIPRLEDVAAIVMAQFGAVNFSSSAGDFRRWDVRGIGQLLLRTCVEFDRLVTRGASAAAAVQTLAATKLGLPQAVLTALSSVTVARQELLVRQIRVKELLPGMILDEDLVSPKGIRLVPAGQEVSGSLIVRLNSIAGGVGVVQPFRVRIPAAVPTS
ncbi:MAG: response regulator [Pseudomonadota bacterium]|nr:response regulator [Pseudomonadota bacterium]